jgi:biotin carboxyl carrier protein
MHLFEKYTSHLPGRTQEVEVARETDGFTVRLPAPAGTVLLTWEETECGRVLVRMGGRPIECRVTRLPDGTFRIEWRGRQVLAHVADDLAERARLAHAAHAGPMPLRSPMPGMVVKVLVEEGDLVTLEQPLLVIEAMKMQNELAAPVAGKIVNLAVKPGEAVEGDQVLLEIRA